MARMIPSIPRDDIDPKSNEKKLFAMLNEYLGPDYYVVHSHQFVTHEKIFDESGINLREIDFLILHKKYGFLIVEAKNTPDIQYIDGEYYYNSGMKMRHGGPYRQAVTAMIELSKSFFSCGLFEASVYKSKYFNKGLFKSCVWFPMINECDFKNKQLPKDASLDITITNIPEPLLGDPIYGLQKRIENIFLMNYVEDAFTDFEFKRVINNFICPKFEIISTPLENAEYAFYELHKEQALVLDYLEEQKTAAITGVAGSGKTLLAIEKARRSVKNGKVLFLCYNSFLCEDLIKKYSVELSNNVDFYTIDSYACHCTRSAKANYCDLEKYLNSCDEKDFPYKTVIIDEGQDFGQKDIEESFVLLTLKSKVYDENAENTGEFYIFYDKNQMVQSAVLCEVIKESDCKLTLYKNCRNTFKIAKTSLACFNRIPKMHKRNLNGSEIEMTFADETDFNKKLDAMIEKLLYDNEISSKIKYDYKDIVILTTGSISKSMIKDYLLVEDQYHCYYLYKNKMKNKIMVTTSRKFKGLESPAVILIDVASRHIIDMNMQNTTDDFVVNESNIYYVASSRAKFDLMVMFSMSDVEVKLFTNSGSDNVERNKKKLIKMLEGVVLTSINNETLL